MTFRSARSARKTRVWAVFDGLVALRHGVTRPASQNPLLCFVANVSWLQGSRDWGGDVAWSGTAKLNGVGRGMPEQISRLLIIFLLVLLGFFVIRPLVIPPSYGLEGRYRAAAVDEIQALPTNHLGSEACESCHAKEYTEWKEAEHNPIACESCHGAGLQHVTVARLVETYPKEEAAAALATQPMFRPTEGEQRQFCGLCHQQRTARPGGLCLILESPDGCAGAFPQTNLADHNVEEGSCFQADCHSPHAMIWEDDEDETVENE